MTSRARVILNPAAGADAAPDYVEVIAARLRERFGSVEVVMTAGPGDAERAAALAVADGCDHVIVGGGDGTLNEAVNGVGSVPHALAHTTFGLLPLGTGNDFAAALGIPPEIPAAIDVLLQAVPRPVDLGWVNARLFANISGGGFIADVSESVTPQMKSIAGRMAYLLGGAQTLMEYEPVGAAFLADPDGLRLSCSVYAFAVCNSRLIGGGKLIAPEALIDDGLLDLCIIEGMPAMEFVGLLRKVAQGSHVDDPRVRYVRVSELAIAFDRPIRINTDGEVLEVSHCEYRVLPSAARFLGGDAPFAEAAGEDPVE